MNWSLQDITFIRLAEYIRERPLERKKNVELFVFLNNRVLGQTWTNKEC